MPSESMGTIMLPSPPTGVKKLGATDHVMLGRGMPVATQVRVAGLVSFTTIATVVIFTSGGSEQGGEGEDCSQYHMWINVCLYAANSRQQLQPVS